MMEAIGGYFGLELRKGTHFHEHAFRLNSARNCLAVILHARKWKKIYLPYYTCEVLLQPLMGEGIEYAFYRIDSCFNPIGLPRLKKDEAIVYTNYFGLKTVMAEELALKYAEQLIVDNAQAFYAPRIPGIDTFYSPRKFFGVPDGGYLYTDLQLSFSIEKDHMSWSRMNHLCRRIDEGPENGYGFFREAENSLDHSPIQRMSQLTESILASIDYDAVKVIRQQNFLLYHSCLSNKNLLNWSIAEDNVPMCYPFLSTVDLRWTLIDSKVYVPIFWKNVKEWCTGGFEPVLSDNLLALPLDQRYGHSDIKRVISLIKQVI